MFKAQKKTDNIQTMPSSEKGTINVKPKLMKQGPYQRLKEQKKLNLEIIPSMYTKTFYYVSKISFVIQF